MPSWLKKRYNANPNRELTKMTGVFDFNEQYEAGDVGANRLAEVFKGTIKMQKGKHPDFLIVSSNQLMELKTDTYHFSEQFSVRDKRTPNLFMELFSDVNSKSIGGPWRAKSEGCTFFAYFFLNNDLLFLFDTDLLVKFLDAITPKMQMKYIANKGWTTGGFPIHNGVLEPISYSAILSTALPFSHWVDGLLEKLLHLDIYDYIASLR